MCIKAEEEEQKMTMNLQPFMLIGMILDVGISVISVRGDGFNKFATSGSRKHFYLTFTVRWWGKMEYLWVCPECHVHF